MRTNLVIKGRRLQKRRCDICGTPSPVLPPERLEELKGWQTVAGQDVCASCAFDLDVEGRFSPTRPWSFETERQAA